MHKTRTCAGGAREQVALRASGDRASAADAYRRAVALNPLLRSAAVQLARLEGREP